MPSYTTADIRNVLLVGHGGCGKTTLADALLFESKAVTKKGSVSDGSSVSDFEKEEKDHKHSIYSSVLHLDHQGKRINLIDAPGSPDLIGHAIAALPAVDRSCRRKTSITALWSAPAMVNDSSAVSGVKRLKS